MSTGNEKSAAGDGQSCSGKSGGEPAQPAASHQAEALRESEERFAATFEQAAVGIAHVAPDGRWVRVNRRLCQIVGYTHAELLQRTFQDITHPDDLDADLINVKRLLAGEVPSYSMEKRYVRGDGSPVWVNLTASLVRSAAGEPKYFISVIEDIDRRKQDESAQARLAAVVESSDDAIISKTLDGTITTWNAAAQRLFGYAAEEVVGRSVSVLLPPDRLDEERDIQGRLRRGERVEHFETVRLAKDGRAVDVSLTVSPVRDRAGNIIGASKIARDITELKKARREMQEAREAAEAAGRAKDRFLAVLSHELRTPLAPVLATVTYLEANTDLPADVRRQLATVRRNVELEGRLVDDLLDLTRISQGKVELHNEVLDAHAAVRHALEVVQPSVDEKGLEVTLKLSARRHHVWADPARIQQVLWNLLSNAVKFTQPGGGIRLHTRNDERDRLALEVTDTGAGIDPDMLPRVFDAFEQGERSVTRQYGGLGLGLTISRALAEMHQGTLTAASEGRGRGATFTLVLNTVPTPAVTGDAPQSHGAGHRRTGLRILVVEDHLDTLHVMARLLRSLGHRVETAASVGAALAAAERGEFDLLISDMRLPDGSGLDVLRHLKGRRERPVRGIALTGYGREEDLRQSREAGFETHLTKPVDFQTLETVIGRMAS